MQMRRRYLELPSITDQSKRIHSKTLFCVVTDVFGIERSYSCNRSCSLEDIMTMTTENVREMIDSAVKSDDERARQRIGPKTAPRYLTL